MAWHYTSARQLWKWMGKSKFDTLWIHLIEAISKHVSVKFGSILLIAERLAFKYSFSCSLASDSGLHIIYLIVTRLHFWYRNCICSLSSMFWCAKNRIFYLLLPNYDNVNAPIKFGVESWLKPTLLNLTTFEVGHTETHYRRCGVVLLVRGFFLMLFIFLQTLN